MSYDRKAARALNLTFRCTAALETPVTLSGYYRCVEGHAHYAGWHHNSANVSGVGYDWAFLAAVDAADEAAIIAGRPESHAYWEVYDRVLREKGYAAVCLQSPIHGPYPD